MSSTYYVQHGILVRMRNCFGQHTFSAAQKTIRLFRSINDYIDEKTEFSDLVLTNFQSIFLTYFLACSAVFVCWLIDLLVSVKATPKFLAYLTFVPLTLSNLLLSVSMNFLRKLKVSRKGCNRTVPTHSQL